MLKKRQFNIVLVTKDQPHPITLGETKGTPIIYEGKAIKINL